MTENFWDQKAAGMPQEEIDQCMAEWEAFREDGDLVTGALTQASGAVLKEHGMTALRLGRVEAAKDLIFACMRRSYHELKAIRAAEIDAPQPKP